MKILMATMGLDIGGAETHIVELAKELKARGLNLNMARGKPGKAQLDLVSDIFSLMQKPEDYVSDGVDVRNYGELSGLPAAKRRQNRLCRFWLRRPCASAAPQKLPSSDSSKHRNCSAHMISHFSFARNEKAGAPAAL